MDSYLAEVISFYDAIQLSFVQATEELILHATSSRSWLEVTAANVLDTFQTTSKVLDQFQLVLHVRVFVSFQPFDVEAKLGRRWS